MNFSLLHWKEHNWLNDSENYFMLLLRKIIRCQPNIKRDISKGFCIGWTNRNSKLALS
jgi:hypothetical protein